MQQQCSPAPGSDPVSHPSQPLHCMGGKVYMTGIVLKGLISGKYHLQYPQLWLRQN